LSPEIAMRAWTRVVVLVMLAGATARQAVAQWLIGLELTTAHYRGSARDTSGTPHAGPGDAATVGLRFERRFGRARAVLRLSYGKPGFSISGQGLSVIDKTAGDLIEAGGLLNFQVGGIGPSGAIRAELGPALHLWKVVDEIRSRVGGVLAASYEWPVAGRLAGALRVEGALSKSWFDAVDLPPEYRRQVSWRYGWGVGLRYRL
jgi:hypothetical protein